MRRRLIVPLLVFALVSQLACGPDEVSKVKKKVADAAAILNSAAKANRSLYQSGTYGAAGSPEAINKRQKVAIVVYQANEYLSMAVERAAKMSASDLPSGKTDIIALLQKAAGVLNNVNIDNENIQVIIKSAVAAINLAVNLTLALKEN
jgi:septum formation topological specificity factor MinE